MYIDLPDYCFAYNAKAGISSFARAIIAQYFTEHEPYIKQLLSENIENHHKHIYFTCVKRVITAYKPVILLVRDPVDRFLSAMNYLQMEDTEGAIYALEERSKIKIPVMSKPIYLYQDVHFRKQATYLSHDNIVFKFPEHKDEAAELLDLPKICVLNASRKPKPKLSEEQRTRILNYYRRDNELLSSIDRPGVRIRSQAKIEWDNVFSKIVADPVSDEAVHTIKSMVNRYPYLNNLIIKDILRHDGPKRQ